MLINHFDSYASKTRSARWCLPLINDENVLASIHMINLWMKFISKFTALKLNIIF